MSYNKCKCDSQLETTEYEDAKEKKTVYFFEKINNEYCKVSYTLAECNDCKNFTILVKRTVEKANMSEIYKNIQDDLAIKMKYIT
jgi:hypothetical protein